MSQFDVCQSPLLLDLTNDAVRDTYDEMLLVWNRIFRGLISEPESSDAICDVGDKSKLAVDEFSYICRRTQRDVLEMVEMEEEGEDFKIGRIFDATD